MNIDELMQKKEELLDLANELTLTDNKTPEQVTQLKQSLKDLENVSEMIIELEKTEQEHERISEVIEPITEQRKTDADVSERIAELRIEQNQLEKLAQLGRLEEKVGKMREKAEEIRKNAGYMTMDADKHGIRGIREPVYQRKLGKLKEKLDQATNRKERINAKMDIFNLQMAKKQIQTTNIMIKIGRGASKFSNAMGEIGNQLSSIGSIGGGFGQEPRKKTSKRRKSKKKKGKKGKRKRKSKSESESSSGYDDMGWNTKTVFG